MSVENYIGPKFKEMMNKHISLNYLDFKTWSDDEFIGVLDETFLAARNSFFCKSEDLSILF